MARTVYFLDGTHEVIFCAPGDVEGSIAAFDTILRERLGNDSVEVLHTITDELKERLSYCQEEVETYVHESEDYYERLRKVRSILNTITSSVTNAPRVNRMRLDNCVQEAIKLIDAIE